MSDILYKKLTDLLNKESAENESNTPDFILAQFMLNCLHAFNQATQQRETWYGRDASPTLHGEGKEPDFARGFQKGVESIQRKNPSGCCCKFDDDKVIEPCGAHAAWAREYCKTTQNKVHDVEEFYKEPDPWKAWRVDAPDPTNFNRWENWAYNVIKWIITMPRGK